MMSQRTGFSLKGTNIHLPSPFKLRKSRPKPPLPDINEPSTSVPFIIQSKSSEPYPSSTASTAVSTAGSLPKAIQNKEYQTQIERELTKKRIYHSSVKNRRCACGDCEECLKDFTYFLHIFNDDLSVPQISAKSWCIWRKKQNGKYAHYYGKRIHKVRQIASLSKMLTAMTAFDFLSKHSIPLTTTYTVRKTSTIIGGTSANLSQGKSYTILDLMYGMMLNSGNDAAIAISEAIGLMAYLKSKNKNIQMTNEGWDEQFKNKNYAYVFVNMMNDKCNKIGTLDTRMVNSHGNDAFDQLKNVSTCNEIAKISSQFLTYPLLRQIARTPSYNQFQNTNKLLDDGFEGIKTGITQTAGPCLAACYRDLIIVVLNSKSMGERWIEVKKLVKWILKKSS